MWKKIAIIAACCSMLNGCIIVSTKPSAEEQQQAELRYYQQMMTMQAINNGNQYRYPYPIVGQQPQQTQQARQSDQPRPQRPITNNTYCCNNNDSQLTKLNNTLESLISKINNRDFGIK